MEAIPLCIRVLKHIPRASEVFPTLGFAFMHMYAY